MFIYVFFHFLILSVLETKDGTVSVAAAFAGHQEGNYFAEFRFFVAILLYFLSMADFH